MHQLCQSNAMTITKFSQHSYWRRFSTQTILKYAIICLLHVCKDVSSQRTSSNTFHRNSGHLESLGRHSIKHSIQVIDSYPSPYEFYTNYVYPSIPVVFKNGAKISPAYSKWTDEYLMNLPESEEVVSVELKKVENREIPPIEMSFKEFVKQYKHLDAYLVESVPDFLGKDVLVPPSLLCDEILNSISDTVMWFSSGGTKSVVHNDDVNNINCLFSGSKEFLFINTTAYRNQIIFDHPEGSFLGVDVEKVDYDAYLELEDVEFHQANISAGDCLFIPYKWIHQVNSIGRNIAVNVWWEHKTDYAPTLASCGIHSTATSIADVTIHEASEQLEPLVSLLRHFGDHKGPCKEEDLLQILKEMSEYQDMEWNEHSLITARGVFDHADVNKDGELTKQDFKQLTKDDHATLMLEQQLGMLIDIRYEQESAKQLEVLKKLQQEDTIKQSLKEEL